MCFFVMKLMNLPHSCKRDDWKGISANLPDPDHIGKKVAIVGYSARALNFVAKIAGFQTLVLDCFADMDLRRSADAFIYVNLDTYRNKEGHLEESAAYYLTQSAQLNSEVIKKADYLITGSSFENDPDSWNKISNEPNYIGNNPNSALKIRDPRSLYPFLKKNSILFPKTGVVDYNQDCITCTFYSNSIQSGNSSTSIPNDANELFALIQQEISVPFVLKSANSGGGLGIFLIADRNEFLEKYEVLSSIRTPPYIIQEYIQGIPMSCSLLADGINAKIHTISRQVIGDAHLGCKGKFTYCGNVMNKEISDPNHENNRELAAELNRIAHLIMGFAQLRGSNGIDFIRVQQKNKLSLYFMELNPRFQGTIDLVLSCTGENLVQRHIQSCEKRYLPDDVCFPDEKTYLKVIYYSPIDFYIMVDLQGLEFRDVPVIGSYQPSGAPICSNIVIGESIEDAYEIALKDRDLMIRLMGLRSRIPEKDQFLQR
jgi:predicted ATP-grasp superfamily ATP-dependent carboligase